MDLLATFPFFFGIPSDQRGFSLFCRISFRFDCLVRALFLTPSLLVFPVSPFFIMVSRIVGSFFFFGICLSNLREQRGLIFIED